MLHRPPRVADNGRSGLGVIHAEKETGVGHMGFWFRKKKQATEMRETFLPGEIGTISIPASFSVKMEDEGTLLACPKGEDVISLRASSISIARNDGNDDTAGKIAVRQRAEERGIAYYEVEDKGILSYDEPSEQDDVPLLVKYWYIGSKNTLVILSATILEAKKNAKVVSDTLALIPRILDSLKITKTYRVVVGEDRQVEAFATTAEPTPQSVEPFGPEQDLWLSESLGLARALGVKYASGGDLTPEELDVVFSRWMHDEDEKESDDTVANALGAAFGDYLVEQHGFRWVLVTDEYGTEYAVRHNLGQTMAFPRASVQKRIEDKCPELFQDVYLIVLDQLKRSGGEGLSN